MRVVFHSSFASSSQPCPNKMDRLVITGRDHPINVKLWICLSSETPVDGRLLIVF